LKMVELGCTVIIIKVSEATAIRLHGP
jgi:hypothetical protein